MNAANMHDTLGEDHFIESRRKRLSPKARARLEAFERGDPVPDYGHDLKAETPIGFHEPVFTFDFANDPWWGKK